MTGLAGRRVVTAAGAMLLSSSCRTVFDGAGDALFTPEYWEAHGAITRTSRGRGAAWFIATSGFDWALRHYRRGGWLATRFALDRFLWRGEFQVRSFSEWRLLRHLFRQGLPVPEPVGASYRRGWLTYRCDLLTRRIPDTQPLSDVLAADRVQPGLWRLLGATLARFHAAGVDHADLNAHNILVSSLGIFSVIDFDRGRVRDAGTWRAANLRRLRRSLLKVTAGLPAGRFTPADWDELLSGYAGSAATSGSGPR